MSQDLVPAFHPELGEMYEPSIYKQLVGEFKEAHDGRHPLSLSEVEKEVAGDGPDSDPEDK